MEFSKLLFIKYQNSKFLKNSTKHLPISSPINVSKRDHFRQFNKGKSIQYISIIVFFQHYPLFFFSILRRVKIQKIQEKLHCSFSLWAVRSCEDRPNTHRKYEEQGTYCLSVRQVRNHVQGNSNCSDSSDDFKVLEIMLLFQLLIYLSLPIYSQYNSLNL